MVFKIKDCPQMKSFISNLGSADEFGQTNSILFDQKVISFAFFIENIVFRIKKHIFHTEK